MNVNVPTAHPYAIRHMYTLLERDSLLMHALREKRSAGVKLLMQTGSYTKTVSKCDCSSACGGVTPDGRITVATESTAGSLRCWELACTSCCFSVLPRIAKLCNVSHEFLVVGCTKRW